MLLRFCSLIFHPRAQQFIIGVIIFNGITLGLETSPAIMSKIGGALVLADQIILCIYVLEILMKLAVLRHRFFFDSWNIFDFLIVGISLIPASGPLSILRALRILRVLRLITKLPRLRIIIESILHALPSIGWVSLLLAIVFYIFSVMCTSLFGNAFQEWFGSIGASMYTLFQMVTMESWSMGIARPVMEVYPMAWALFIPFLLVTAFVILNVFVGVIVSSMDEIHRRKEEGLLQQEGAAPSREDELAREMEVLREQLSKVEKMLRELPEDKK
ncbi:MAG: ion transporter [Desulfovibrionaceae bacterium]|nr:ion transporter [Desulfovibrionaceae bacterium]